MTGFVKNMIWNSVSGFVEEGKRTVGGFAGDALIKAGDMVEGGGRSVGSGTSSSPCVIRAHTHPFNDGHVHDPQTKENTRMNMETKMERG